MDELNKLETVPTVDALVKEEPIVEDKIVEPSIEPTPVIISEPTPESKPVSPKPAKADNNLVSLYSAKNFVGIAKGYSKVDKTLAQELLKNKNIRLATEEEVKTHLNK